MKLYLDGSGLVKLLIREPESPAALSIWDQADRVVSAGTIVVEGRAAIARRLARPVVGSARRELTRRLNRMVLLEVDELLLARAATTADRFRVRALDAIHLAAAAQIEDSSLVFATWDRELSRAASAARLTVYP